MNVTDKELERERTPEKAQPQDSTPPKKKDKDSGPIDAVWKFFSSVHLAVILLLILASISIIGTVLAQGDSAADNIKLFENFLYKFAGDSPDHDRIHAAAERLYRFSDRVGFTNLYHAWYFYFLLALFSMNLLICSLKRWPHTWRLMARNPVALDERRMKSMANRRSVTVGGAPAEAAEKVRALLGKAGYKPKEAEEGGARCLFGQKGVYSRLGVYSTHLSIIVILVGGIIGVTTGFKGYMQITEGTAENRFYDRRSKTTKRFDFHVRCDNFHVQYYDGSRAPKDYYSDLTVIKDGVEVKTKRIEVNDPLTFDPTGSRWAESPFGWLVPQIYFYQSSFGETGRGVRALFRITDPATGTVVEEPFSTRPKEIPGMGVTMAVLQVLPDFALDESQKPYSKSNQPLNPAALIEVTDGEGASHRTWLFLHYPEVKMAKDFPYEVVFADYGGIQYTGLQVVYDPGVWVIWLGCIVMVIGLYLAFFVSHRRVWARIEDSGGGSTVLLAGSANKNRDAFAEEFEKLGSLLEGKGEEASK